MELQLNHDFYMQQALKEARKALDEDEIPVGAVIVADGRIIGKGYNQTQRLNDVTAHAEMLAFTAASNALGSKYLKDCTLYVTLEPCPMCAGAAFWTQISTIVYGASDDKRGYQLFKPGIIHPKTEIISGVLAQESETLLKDFFKSKRKK